MADPSLERQRTNAQQAAPATPQPVDTAAAQSGASRAAQRDGTASPGQAGTSAGAQRRQQILDANPNGVVVAVYAAYNARVSDAAEFQRRADEFAGIQAAVGLNAQGELVSGVSVAVTTLAQVGERIQAIHRALLGDTTVQPQPRSAMVRSLALFSHGEPFGMGMEANNAFTLRATNDRGAREAPNTDTTARTTSDSVTAFVTSLRGAVTGDVRVQLFSCSAGRDQGQREAYEDWVSHAEGERRGQNSFASELSGALGEDASVYAHTTTGHTTENYAARVFGHDAGGGQGGLQLFEVLYPRSFIEAEVLRPAVQQILHRNDGPPANAAADYRVVREAMWAHYRASIGPGRRVGGRPIGQEMMVNPSNAARLLQADWTSRLSALLSRRSPRVPLGPARRALFRKTGPPG